MEERRVSFAAQNEIDAEQAFLNSMRALQEEEEASTPAAAAIKSYSSSVGGEGRKDAGMSLSGDDDTTTALIGNTLEEEQKDTPGPDAGASSNFATTPRSSSGLSSPVKQGVIEDSTSTPSSSNSSHRRAGVPFSYDEEDNESGSVDVMKEQNGDRAQSSSQTPEATDVTPIDMEGNLPGDSHVSVSAAASIPEEANMPTPSPSISLVVSDDAATPSSTTNELPQSSNGADVSRDPPQGAVGVVDDLHSSNVAGTSNTGVKTAQTNITPAGSVPPAPAAVATIATATNKRKRLPQDKVGQLEDRIAADPRGDMDAWVSLIAEHKRKGKFDEARAVFERFFLVFPACVRTGISFVPLSALVGILADRSSAMYCGVRLLLLIRRGIYRPSSILHTSRWSSPTTSSVLSSKSSPGALH